MERPIRTRFSRGLLVALPLALLAACATPRHETYFRYDPPADTAGRVCVAACERDLQACKDRCAGKYQACLTTVEPRVEARYVESLERYAMALEDYRRELEHHEFQMWLGWHRSPYWYDRGWGGYGHGWGYTWWPSPYWLSTTPSRPTREGAREALRRELCERDCGCQPPYDACFVACGGQRVEVTRCVANCPKVK